jgi:predicted nucleic-acid-binding protein
MIAVDTNVLARYLLNDDFIQAKAAARLLAGRKLMDVPLSVWFELVRLLQINEATNRTSSRGCGTGLPSVRPRALDVFHYALRWYEEGMDFGDALHLAMSAGNERFASFDHAMAKMAAKIGASPRVTQA